MKRIDAVDLFTKVLGSETRKEAFRIYTDTPVHQRNDKLSDLLAPYMPVIDAYVGQENALQYMAYLLEHTFNSVGEF